MFRACTIDEITEVLAKKPEQFFDEREELDDLAFEDNTEYYRSEDCLLVVSPGRIRAEMYAMPLTPDFDLGKLEAFASKRAQSFRMHLNVTGLDPDALRFAEPYDISDAVLSLAASKPADEVPGKPRPGASFRSWWRMKAA